MRIFRFFANAAFIFGALFILNSCEVGLGESVDVTAPSLDISSPADGSIIMNTFNLRGTSSDDTYISLLKIVVSSTSNGRVYANYFATVDVVTKQWNVNINNRTKKADGTYAYEIPDGEYTVSVTAIDSAGRTTEKSRVYKIDNTPPVVVIKRPGATDSGGRADSFGKTIKLTGDIADSNSLSSLYFTWFREDASGKLEKIGTLREANISGVGLDLVIGKSYNEGDLSDDSKKRLNEMYEKIYGHKVSSAYNQSENVYCVVQVADSAKEFNPPASNIEVPKGFSEPGFTPTGNLSTGYYIYKTIYSNIYSDGGYGLSNSDIVSLLNGSSSRSDSSDILKYLEQNKIDTTREYSGVSVEDITANPDVYKIAKFSVNPNNSPYFEVSGYKVENDSAVPGKKKFSELANESKITVSVSSGRDQIEIDPDSVKVMLKKCDEYGNIIEGLDAETVTLINSQYEINEMSGDEKTAAQALRDDALTPDEIIKIVCGIGKRYAKRNYIVIVEGYDIDNNPIDTLGSELYGFVVTSLNKPPVVNVSDDPAEAPEDLSSYKNAELSFRGTGSYSTEEFEGIYCTVTAKNEKTGEAYPARENEVLLKLEDSDITLDTDAREFTWKFDLNDAKIRDIFNISGIPENSLCLYTVSFTAVDGDRNESAPSFRRIHVDTAAPVIDKISYTPKVMYNGNPCVNGKINVTVSVTENQELYDLEVGLKVEGEQDCLIKKNSSNLSAELEYNTYLIGDGKYKGNLLVIVKATDIAGNTIGPVTAKTIFVDPESDLPQIKFGNAKQDIKDYSLIKESPSEILNLYDQGNNNKINATITDDDNVGMVILRYLAFDPVSMTYDSEAKKWNISEDKWTSDGKTFFNYSGQDLNPYPMSAALMASDGDDKTAMPEGLYLIRYEITDKKTDGVGSVTATNKGDEFVIGVDAAAPKITVSTQSGELVGANLPKTINGTLSDGNKVSLYRYSTNTTRNNGKYGDIDNKVPLFENKSYSEYDGKWSDTIETTDNGDELAYLAVDQFGRKSQVTFNYRIDSVKPLVDVTLPEIDSTPGADNNVYIGTSLSTIASFRGTAFDVKYVKISGNTGTWLTNEQYNSLSDSDKSKYKEVDDSGITNVIYNIKDSGDVILAHGTANGSASWSANIDFSDDSGNPYNAASVEFKAVDGAGLESDAVSRPVVVDSVLPEINITKVEEFISSGNELVSNEGIYYSKATSGNSIKISGTVTEKYFKSLACNSSDGRNGTIVFDADEDGDGVREFTYTIENPINGRKTYTFTATDKANQIKTESVEIFVDSVLPNPKFTVTTLLKDEVNGDQKSNIVNDKIFINGSSTDNDVIEKTIVICRVKNVENVAAGTITKIKLLVDGSGNPSLHEGCPVYIQAEDGFVETVIPDEKVTDYNFYVDTTTLAKGEYEIEVRSTDRAGNVGSYIADIFVNQESDRPKVRFTNMNGATAKENLFGLGSTVIYGSAEDDDGIRKITYKIDNGAEEIYYELSGAETPSTTQSISLNVAGISPSFVSGEHSVVFTVYDVNSEDTDTKDNSYKVCTPVPSPFGYDTAQPFPSVTSLNGSLYQDSMFAPHNFTVVGTATDDYKIDGVSQIETVVCNENPSVNLWDSATKTWTDNVTGQADTDANTPAVRNYTVTDYFGRSATLSISFRVDTAKPVFNEYPEVTNPSASDFVYRKGKNKLLISDGSKTYTENEENGPGVKNNYFVSLSDDTTGKPVHWFKGNSITISGRVTDANFNSVELFVGSETTARASQQSANFSFTNAFDVGQQLFKLVATDKAGNETVLGPYTIYIDTSNPSITSTSVKDSGGNDVTGASVLKNTETLKVAITAQDPKVTDEINSGIRTISAGRTSNFGTALGSATFAYGTGSESEVTKELSVPLAGLEDGSHTLYGRVTDAAGNYGSDTVIQTFTVDTTNPVVRITSHSNGSVVNKTITLNGSVIDANIGAGAVPVLYYSEDNTDWTAATTVTGGMVSDAKIENSQWSLKFDTSKVFNGNTSKDYYIAVAISDAAGNINDYTAADLSSGNVSTEKIKISIDQDSDRPEITFNNVTLSNIPAGESSAKAMTSSNSVWIRTSVIYGTVKDDDGVSSVEYSLDGTNYSDTYEDAEGSTQQVYENGSWQILIPDGAASVYFKVTDTEGTEFTSSAGTAGSPLASIDLNAPKIKDSKPNNYGYRTGAGVTASQNIYDTVLYATFDTTSPDIPYYYYTRNDCSEITAETLSEMDKWTTAKIEDAGWKSLNQISTEIFGGPGSKFYIWTKASDANGINALFIKLGENVQTEKVHKKIDPITTGTKKDGYYLGLYEIDTSKDDGTVSLVINAKDAANGTADQKFMLVQDNAAPMVTIRSPSSSGMNYYGSVNNNMHGITEDAHGIKELYIGFSASKTTRPASYERIDQYTAASGWSITFDGESPENTPGSIIYLAQNLNKYLDTVYGTGTSATDVIKDLYVWMYAVDEYGNSSENDSDSSTNTNRLEPTRILVTTQGDKPTVSIAYPVMDAIGSNAIAPTVGGTVRINGSTSIAADSVEAIWIQIDPEPVVETTEIAGKTYVTGITTFHDNWHSTLQGLMNAKGVTGYKIESSSDESSSDEGPTVPAGIGYGIKAKGTASSWSLSVNAQSELNKQVDGVYVNRYIAIRAYAVSSTNHKISEAFTVPVVIDPSAPVFGGTTSLVLVKRSGDAADGEIVQSINYEPDMWISGQWYLTGSVEDDSGISHLYFNDNDLVVSGNFIKENSISSSTSAKNYNINIPVGSSAAEDFGPLAYTLEAYEGGDGGKSTPLSIKLNLDNKSPDFSADLAASGNRVLQSNGTYTITGTFNEPSSGAKNQSGFNRIVLFFTRTIGGTTYIVDPMITNKSVVSGTTVYDANQYSVTGGSGFTKDEAGIYWRTLYVQFFDSNEVKLSETEGGAVLDVNALAAKNVRIGGLININKVTFRIDGIKADGTLTLNNTPAVIAENDKALCALAQIIDHVTREQGTTASYNQLVPDKDDGDGDQMIEGVWLAGGKYNWEAELYSLNIADGPIDIHLVAFDAAGNHTADNVYSGSVINNQPRIAGIYFGTDNNGNGSVDEEELTKYSSLYDKDDRVTNLFVATELNSSTGRYMPVHQKETPSDLSAYSSAMIIKGNSIVRPEIIGGNAGLDYTYTIKKSGESAPYYTKPAVSELSSGHYEYTDSPSDVARTFYNETTNPTGVKNIDLSIKQILTHGSTSNSAADYIDGSKQLFSFTISDRTAGGVQTAKIDMLIDVALLDSENPTISMIPFYWKNNVDNSIYKTGANNTLNGHIELEDDWLGAAGYDSDAINGEYDSDPKVSGTIVLEGTSNDNVRLNKLFIKIPGYTDSMGDDGTANSGKMLMAYRDSAGKWKSNGNLSDNGWVWTQVGDEVFDAVAGNTVNWSFTWNTAKTISTVAKADVEIQIFAQDMGPVSSVAENGTVSFGRALMSATATEQTTKAENTARYKVDVVPYITSVTTSLGKLYNDEDLSAKNKSVYGRTALGKYPVYETEEITVCGFNIPTTAAVKVGTTDLTGNSGSRNEIVRQIPSNTASGELVVSVSGVTNLNNKNKDNGCGEYSGSDVEQLYNMQPNGINNNLLNDDIALDVWTFEEAARPRDGEILTPEMQIGPNGEVGFAFVNGNFYFNMAGPSTYGYTAATDTDGIKWASQRSYEGDYAPYYESALAFDAKGMTYGISTNQDSNNQYSAYTSFYFGQRGDAVYGYTGWDKKSDGNYNNGSYRRRLQSTTSSLKSGGVQDTSVFRAMSPSVATVTNDNDTSVYLAFYDAVRHEIRYRWGNIGNILEKKIDSVTSSEQEYKQITKVDEEGSGWRYGHIEAGYLANNEKNITNYNLNNTSFSKAYGGGEEVYLYKADGTLYEKDGQNKFYTGYNFNQPGTWFRIHKTNEYSDIAYETKAISPFPSYNKDAGNKTNRWYLSKKYYPGGLKLDVINATNHGLKIGDEITLTFENNSFMNEKYTRVYYVNNVLDNNSFTVSSEANSAVCTLFSENPPKAFSKITGQIIDASGGYSTAKVKPGTDTGTEDKSVRSALYSVVDKTSATKMTAAVAIGAVPASVAGTTNDVAVIAWFDGTSKKLKYAYEEDPQRDDDNVPGGLFQSSPYTKRIVDSNAGYYVHLKVDASGGIHIAYFTTTGAKLKYGYAKDYKSEFNIVTVDSFNLNGNNDIGLDVAKDSDGNWTPYISYLAGAQAAKVAYPVKWEGNKPKLAGQDSSGKYSQNWEISFVPSENRTPKNDTVCVGVNKLWTGADAGLIQPIPKFTKKINVSGDDTDSNQSTRIGGNGTANPALAYTIIEDDILQYAQKN